MLESILLLQEKFTELLIRVYKFISHIKIRLKKLLKKDFEDNYDKKIFEDLNHEIYSNAIFSLGHEFFSISSLLVFGSKDKHFLNNKAYDFILFFSNIVQEKLKQFSNE